MNLNLNFKNLRVGIAANIVVSSLKSFIRCNNMNYVVLKIFIYKIPFVMINIRIMLYTLNYTMHVLHFQNLLIAAIATPRACLK